MVRNLAILVVLFFAGGALTGTAMAAAANGIPTAGTYLIHPGDQLNVQVYGDQTLTQNLPVLADGSLDFPLVGRVVVAGMAPPQAAKVIAARLAKYVRNPVVTIAVMQLAQPSVLVLGDVKNPGKYQLRSDGRISDAIAAAGGLGDIDGGYPEARIADPAGNVTKVSLEQLFRQGDTALDERLAEGTVVYVPGPVQFNVSVVGAVDHPGTIEVNTGDTVSIAIAKAGNSSNSNADLNDIRVIRTDAGGAKTTEQVNLYKALKEGDMSADVALQKGDVVFVPENKKKTDFFSAVSNTLGYILFRLIIP